MRRNAADQAEGMEEEAESLLALSREVHGDDSPEVVDALHMLAHVSPPELRLQRHEEAVTHALESLGEAQTETLSAMRCLATMYGSKNPNRLVELREKVVAGYDALNEAGATPQTLGYLLELVKAYETAGYWEKARTAAEKLVTLSRKRLGPDHPRTTQAESKLEELMPRDLRVPLSEEVRQLSAFTPTDATSALKNLMYAGIVAYHENRVEHEALTEMIISQMRVEEEKMNLMMMAKTIHLMPPSANGPTSAHREAQVLQEAASESLELDHFLLLDLALGACRVEDWDRLELLLKDGSTPLNRPGFRVSGHSLRAISSWQKGQRALALQELNLAKRFYEADSRTGKGHPFDVVLYPHLILREALELIEGNRDWLPPLQTLEDQQIPATIVPPNSVWRWLHPLDGVDPAKKDPDFHETFAEKDFDDSFWKAGQDSAEPGGGFGYGDDWFTGVDIGLPMVENATYGLDGKAAYFRLKFKTEREFRNLELRCQRDDGIIVYLNGKEVARDNMQAGEARYDIPAVEKVAHDKPIKEQVTYRIPLPGAILRPGEHVLAISVHNTEGGSSDLRIGGISLVEVVESHRENIPPRPEDRDRKEIDLSEHYTVSLASKLWSLKHPGHDLSRLAQTFTPRHGVTFDLRGAIWLESGKTASGLTAGEFGGLTLKTSVEGIVVNEVTPRIHFLAGAQWVTTIGERLARFVIHYENGSTTEMPVVLGPDGVVGLRMVAFETVVGWKGSISENETQGVLSELIWDNPHPDKIITTIDFVSELSPRGAPFLVAITLE